MPCCLCNKATTAQQIQTIIASINNCPPSPFDCIPITVRCETIAPLIKPILKTAPINIVAGTNSNMPAISSITPVLIPPRVQPPVL